VRFGSSTTFKREYRDRFDVRIWIDCSFATALERALARGQEGLPPAETIEAYQWIYIPAQRFTSHATILGRRLT
jgi:hypothetical protein